MASLVRVVKSQLLQRQRGAALLVLITALLAATAYATLQLSSASRSRLARQEEITRSLAFAKSALIAYAVTYVDNYGHNTRGGVGRLPCPSLSRYGSPARSCGQNAIGFLPGIWSRGGKRIDIDHLEKFLRQDLWYGLSADFRYNPAFNRLNSNTFENLLSVNGNDDVVAVLIAPGSALAGQSRISGEFSVRDYLEGENADQDSVFSTVQAGNDQLMTITRSELMPGIEKRVLGYVRDWLLEYKTAFGHFPYAAPFADPLAECQQGLTRGKLPMRQGNCNEPPLGELVSQFVPRGRTLNQTWFANSAWSDFIFYQLDEGCAPDSPLAACGRADMPPDIPPDTPADSAIDNVESSLLVNGLPTQVLLVSVGRAIATGLVPSGQQRVATVATDVVDMRNYFDTAELVNAVFDYDLQQLESLVLSSDSSNDQFLVIRQ